MPETRRMMWRCRPFSGGTWIVCPTTIRMADYLAEEASEGKSFEVQLVEMSEEEFKLLPVLE